MIPFLLLYAMFAADPKPFKIVQAGIHQMEDGPLATAGISFVPGETVYFRCQLEGYQVSAAKKVSITYEIEAVDPLNTPTAEKTSGKIEADLAPQDKDWKPVVRQALLVPPLGIPGIYKVKFTAKDALSGSAVAVEVPFEVHGHQVEPSETLAVRNFRFYRGEDEAQPLDIAAYRPGDTVWARFDIAGYKLGPGNQVHVSYSITVIGLEGKVLFSQKEPSVEKSSSFYPMRWVPCVINLSLQPNIRPAQYDVTVSLHDYIGNQDHQSKSSFRVE